jgi:hypothetical protein
MNEEYKRRFDLIAINEYSDKSKLVRKWIDNNFKEEYNNTEKKCLPEPLGSLVRSQINQLEKLNEINKNPKK